MTHPYMTHPYRPLHAPQLQPQWHRHSHSVAEYAPSDRLASHVAAYWAVDFQPVPGNHGHRAIPDGCVDIILDLRAASSRRAAYVVGLKTHAEVMRFAEARSVFGIRLYAESARTLLRTPLSEFAANHVFIEEVWGPEALEWSDRMIAAASVADRIEIAERQLERMLTVASAPATPLMHQSMQYIYDCKGNLSVSDLANKVSFSERHLRRAFERELGLSPKEMMGIVRFQSVLEALSRRDYPSLADLALQYGYYDQSHFGHTFARYYGLPLKQLTQSG
ncbi:helix-turn-helix transcriptional regulator [Cohnella hashimotonis]|uniref:Helix-turn-helix transcriptional regulator n=1 Tax=Cohnella hashimotonis TaxID=2826895 RepID=A0ABT6TM88_9BACL|nr:helix-turn-helix transcriptional regulator [Cohnella hashimotonis]MDI4647958.1 helix-turn-helix transcriptional regulator [Cohnella hashimotonis]